MGDERMRSALRVTKALSDEQRIRILMMLRAGELCVCQIVEVLGLAPSTVSKHLSVLDVAGLVDSRKEGRWMHYRLPGGKAGAFVAPVLAWLEEVLRRDGSALADEAKLKRVRACAPQDICRRQRRRGAPC